jgi:hypothetical protein
MKALTIWQPWASLIMVNAKPFEFRHWSYAKRFPALVGQRIVIHAGAPKVKEAAVKDLLARLVGTPEQRASTGLNAAPALDLLSRCWGGLLEDRQVLPLSHGLGTAVLGKPRLVRSIRPMSDSDRKDQELWAWPLLSIEPFEPPVPAKGAQGFWTWGGGHAC